MLKGSSVKCTAVCRPAASAYLHAAGRPVHRHVSSTSGGSPACVLFGLHGARSALRRTVISYAADASGSELSSQAPSTPSTSGPGSPSSDATAPPWALERGHVYDATVTSVQKGEAKLNVNVAGLPAIPAVLPVALVSSTFVEDLTTCFTAGEQLKVLAIMPKTTRTGVVSVVATRNLEHTPGAMLTDRQGVYEKADKQAAAYRAAYMARGINRQTLVDQIQVGATVEARIKTLAKSTRALVQIEGIEFRVPKKVLDPLGPLELNQIIKLKVTGKSDKTGDLTFALPEAHVDQLG